MSKAMFDGMILSQRMIGDKIYDLRLSVPRIAETARAGQFVNLFSKDRSRLLPRPISICEADPQLGILRLVYRMTGSGTGTEEFSKLRSGDSIRLMGPLGNGFPLDEFPDGSRILLAGGGIGIPPMLETAKRLNQKRHPVITVLGYRDRSFMAEEFAPFGELHIATEDGSSGVQGTVLDAMKTKGISADYILACGPRPMLAALKQYAEERKIPCLISMEERMACGIGACLGCVCATKKTDAHTNVHNKRVCVDGPVFRAEDIIL